MPCDSKIITPQQQANARTALVRLEAAIATGAVTVKIGRNGALAFNGWTDEQRNGLTDLCAYRKLANSPALRRAIARAEVMAGAKLDQRQIAAGTHSHDGGDSWHKGH